MDEIDKQIIGCLRRNARMTASAIGGQVNLSVSAVIERIKKMEASGIIRQYTAILHPSCLGRDVLAFIGVSLEHPRHNDAFIQRVQQINGVIECYYVTGDYDFIVKAAADSTRALDAILSEIKEVHAVSQTRSFVVLSVAKQDIPGLSYEIPGQPQV